MDWPTHDSEWILIKAFCVDCGHIWVTAIPEGFDVAMLGCQKCNRQNTVSIECRGHR